MTKISGKINIAELERLAPELVGVLMEEYNFHCVGCMASEFESLAEGATAHGMSQEEIEEMLADLNKRWQVLSQKKGEKKSGGKVNN